MMHLVKNMTFNVSTAPAIVVKYTDLIKNVNLKPVIEQAYGPKGKSIYTKVSEYSSLRAFLTINNKDWLLYRFFIDLPTFLKRL